MPTTQRSADPLGPHRLTADERRAAIIEAAVTAFAEGGLAGTSTEEVARIAGVSQPYLFRLFGTKRELFLAAVGRCFDRIGDAFEIAAARDGSLGREDFPLGLPADAMHYPPAGKRGVAVMHRASRYGHVPDYLKTASDALCLILQLETLEALSRLEEIGSVQGVDALFIGPGDLSASMGLLGQPDHPKVQEVAADALERARRLGTPLGILAPNPGAAERYIAMGFAFVSVANDLAMLVQSADASAARYRELAEARERSVEP